MTLLQTEGLTKHYGGLLAVDGVDLSIQPGHIIGLVGPNGAGKSTLFHMLSGFVQPASGRIQFKGREITYWSPERRAALGLARTFQRSRVFPNISVEENVRIGSFLRERSNVASRLTPPNGGRQRSRFIDDRVDDILRETGLEPFRRSLAMELSFGFQRLLGVAIALGTNPELLLLDEPFSGLSPETSSAMAKLTVRLHERGITLFLIEHRMDSIVTSCNRLFVMREGRLIIPHPTSSERAYHVER